jgi:hypothetical protein
MASGLASGRPPLPRHEDNVGHAPWQINAEISTIHSRMS